MINNEQELLTQIAERVANGERVDWAELTRSNPRIAVSIQNLRNIEALGQAFQEGPESGAEPARAEKPPSLQTWGGLRILERIGAGSFGEVFRAHDPLLQRDVALKLRRSLNEEEKVSYHRHLAEARHLARVHHANVLPIHGVEIHDGRPGMWMEFIDGPNLEQVLEAEGPLSADAILEIALCLSGAIRAVHESDLVHGDIKTSNVVRRRNGHLLLMDFGAGRDCPLPEEGDAERLESGAHQGTPLAMAPELLRGDPPTVRSDLYAFGVLLYRLASGRYPIEAQTWADLIEKSERAEQVPLAEIRPGLPTALVGAIHELLSVPPELRPESAGEFEANLTLGFALKADASSDLELDRIHGLPVVASPLIGRTTELREAYAALGEHRRVTLTGPGGSGKTRLAQEMTRLFVLRYAGGCWWVSLAALRADSQVEAEVARCLGEQDRPGVSNLEMIQSHFARGTSLLVLDNAEHVQQACADLAGALAEPCPNLHILTTSRVVLGVPDEQAIPIPPLSAPPPDVRGAEINDYDAVRLFIERAHQSRSSYVFTISEASAVAQICRRLEGIPLAIELAAARVRNISVPEIAERLEDSLKLLMKGETSSEVSLHATLQASIAWSYDALEAHEQQLLARLSVFRGGWSLRAAEAVCGEPEPSPEDASDPVVSASVTDPGLQESEVVDLLGNLVDRSLVVFEPGSESKQDRYRLLEMIWAFAVEKLKSSRPGLELQLRHLRYFRELAEQGKEQLQGPEQEEWAIRLDREFDNFEQAFATRSEENSTTVEAMRLAASLAHFWDLRGMITLGIRHAREVLARPDGAFDRPRRSSLLTALGIFLHMHGQNEESIAIHEQSRLISEATGGRRGVAASLSNMGMAHSMQGDLARARDLTNEALAIMEELEDDIGIALTLNLLGGLDLREKADGAAVEKFQRSLSIQRDLGNHDGVALLTFNIGAVLHNQERPQEAEVLVAESLAIYRRIGNRIGGAMSLSLLGRIEQQRGEPRRTLQLAQEAIEILQEGENPARLSEAVDLAGAAAVQLGHGEWSARLHGTIDRFRADNGIYLSVDMQREFDERRDQIRELIGETALGRALAEGGAMTLEEAAVYALKSPTDAVS